MAENTAFESVYKSFFSKVTDDMYMELTKDDTEKLVCELLVAAVPKIEFPRVDLTNYDVELEEFGVHLSNEEINLVSHYMVVEWIGQQINHADVTRMFYTANDFKSTSQANHLRVLLELQKRWTEESFHLQRLYKRRYVNEKGELKPTMRFLVDPYDYEV